MKKFIVVAVFLFASFGVGVTNATSLDEINGRLEDIQDEITFQQDMQLYNQALRNSNQIRSQSAPPLPKPESYKNTMSNETRLKNASALGLNMSEYLKRDEIGSIQCEKYLGRQNSAYQYCYFSKMLNISASEAEMRINRAKLKCNGMQEASHKKCIKDVIVLNN